MTIVEATRDVEQWVERHVPVVRDQLSTKHKKMEADPIQFLRGTFYRWAQLWPTVCKDLAKASTVLAVGDLHIASFGTWRDMFGRLVWGVDDFDEAYTMPYASDLVRLATSAVLDADEANVRVAPRNMCDAILDGYMEGLKSGGKPFVLEEHHKWLRSIALNHLDDPPEFWKKLDDLPSVKKTAPFAVMRAIAKMLPEPRLHLRVVRRTAGIGSLGHPRYVAIFEWRGGQIALEAKAALPSTYVWARSVPNKGILYQQILSCASRCPDPFVQMDGHWLLRRLAPDSSPIELESLSAHKDQERLLAAMGRETANVHLGTRGANKTVLADLRKRRAAWLESAVMDMRKTIKSDWKDWKRRRK